MCCAFWKKLSIYCCFKTFYLSIILSVMLDTIIIFLFYFDLCMTLYQLTPFAKTAASHSCSISLFLHECFQVPSLTWEKVHFFLIPKFLNSKFNVSLNVKVHFFCSISSEFRVQFTSSLSPKFTSFKFNVLLNVKFHFLLIPPPQFESWVQYTL